MNVQIPYLKALLVILVFTLYACEKKNDSDETAFGSQFSVKHSTTYIEVDSLGLTIYPSEPHVFQNEGQDFLYVYNRPLHSLDVYNLTERHFNYRIMLAKEGPNYINKFYKLNVNRPDSLYIMGASKLYLIDDSGRLLKAYNMSFINYEGIISGQFRAPNEANFRVNGPQMIGFFQHNNARGSGKKGEAFEQSILGLYDLDKEVLSFLPISYSSVIIENEGDFAEIRPNFSFIGDKLFYGFPIESNIYEYDFLTQKTKIHSAESRFSENNAKKQSQSSDYDFRNEGTWFNRLNHYPEKPYFYRTHWGSQNKLTPNGEPTDASTKPGYIMFFDNELRVIDEIKIDDNCYLEGSFATDEGIFFWAKDGEDESQIKFCHYYIE